jgi:membrane-associated phospholipid phosphatase
MEPLSPLLALAVASSTLTAAPSPPAYDLQLEIDIPVLVVAGALSSAFILRDELAPPYCGPNACTRDSVFVLDRFAAGRFDAGFRTVSDVSIAATYGLAVVSLIVDEGPMNALNDAVVVAQSILLSNALGVVTNLATRRPRPLAYGTEASVEERSRGNASLSFFSGHTAGSFAAALAMYSTFKRLHPDSILPYVVLGIGLSAASFVGVSRILAGDHFPTDVLVGAAVGTSLGLLVPALHDAPVQLSGSGGPGQGSVVLSGQF